MYNRYRPYYPTTIKDVPKEITLLQKWLSRWSYSPTEWGPRLWYYLHTSSIFAEELSPLTDEQWKALQLWFQSINKIIPCKKCSTNLFPYTQVFTPIDITRVFIQHHNKINQRFGKPILSEDEARHLHTSFIRRRGNR